MRAGARLLLGCIALSLAALPLHAETSSWSTKTQPGKPADKPKPMARPQPKGPKPLKPGQSADPVTRFTPAKPDSNMSRHVAPATGEDAAYIAFDQGQYLTALDLAERAAGRGDPQAHTLVGRIYAEGLGVPKDEAVAARWYARGAELGDIEAAFALGLQLAEGHGVEKDRAAAASMFEMAAAKGHAFANYNLGLLFLNGDGKPENPRRAALHIQYAAEKGVVAAQYDLAVLYQTGHGVEPNAFEAARWMRQAAEQGLIEAEYDYALMLLRGFGLNAEAPKAVDYLRSAAEKGFAGAQNRLAHLLADESRGRVNLAEAAKWRILARQSGLEDKALDAVVAKLPAAERLAAEKAAHEWRERASVGILAQ
ncbi:MAG: sel1 repeat family protein [Hyphomicrobiaceae bacterium]|nr:sel1 repeat family protein [Hyphomicrobiaceae bacterium]